jgi:TetR/AcrR family transcriptional regulator, tetracycline repressor protein
MTLRQEAVVRAALRLLDEVGLDGLSLRRLAKDLDVQAAALYWHFKDKQELFDRMAEEMLAEEFAALRQAPEPEPDGWGEWLRDMMWRLRRSLRTHRDGARLFALAQPAAESLFVQERMTQAFAVAGFSSEEALRNARMVASYTLGFVLDEQASEPMATRGELPAGLDGLLSSGDYPTIQAALAESGPPNSNADFRYGTDVLLRGMAALLDRHDAGRRR